jgi:putative transposase
MQTDGLQARPRKRFKPTTDSQHIEPVAPNLFAREFTASALDLRWVGDTIELSVGDGSKVFLAAILDLFSRFVVGWAVSIRSDRYLVAVALDMAFGRRRPDLGLLHHSDGGSPYASQDHRAILEAHGMTCSMSGRAGLL